MLTHGEQLFELVWCFKMTAKRVRNILKKKFWICDITSMNIFCKHGICDF